MKWLHLSDLHFDPENAGLNTTMLRDTLPRYLEKAGIQADHLFVTGDFRHARRQKNTDEVAKEAADFLRQIAESVESTNPCQIHIVPGNHDLTRVDGDEGVKRLAAIRQDYEKEGNRPEGCFTKEELDDLLDRFSFFRRMVKALSPDVGIWEDSLLPLHPHACFDDFSLVHMNTAVTCGTDSERGSLVVGTMDLYESLKAIHEKSPGKPVIVLAHHSPQSFSHEERLKVEDVFSKFSDLALYLCGDEHNSWIRTVNALPHLTAGCLVQGGKAEVVFYTGELRNGKFSPPQAHFWLKNDWNVFPQLNTKIKWTLAGIRHNYFFAEPFITISNLAVVSIPLSKHFTGREKDLERIHNAFARSDTISLTQSIQGLGGVGKTQIALKYTFLYEKTYEYLWWIDAVSEATILDGYKAFLKEIQLPMDPKASPKECVDRVRTWMHENDNWLFIFDNSDGYERDGKTLFPDRVLREYLPPHLEGIRHVLITSRYANWLEIDQCIDIDVFSSVEARDFLTNYTGLKNDSYQDDLAAALGYLPLALEQAAAYIDDKKESYKGYLKLFSKYSVEILKRHPGEDDSKRIVYTTWNISRDQIKKRSALQLLDLLSFFAPDNIDVSWFLKGAEHLPEPLQTDIQNDLEREDILADLFRYSLVTRRDEHLSLHRLVQEVIRGSLETEKRDEAAECCLSICAKCVFGDFSTAESRQQFSELQPHMLSVLNVVDDRLPATRASLYMFLGYGTNEQGNYDTALEQFEEALSIREKVLGPDHPSTATTYNNIAFVYDNMGEYDKALREYEKALAIWEKVLGPDHPDTAATYNNMASVYDNMGEYDKALEGFQKALSIREKVLGPDHPSTAVTYNNIASVYNNMGEYDKALREYEKALAIWEKVLGPDHPDTAASYNNIASVYYNKGAYDKALEWHEKALAIREKVLGPDHPSTATTYNNIASVYYNRGAYDKALGRYEKALTIWKKVLGLGHPTIATAYNNIASVYNNMGEYDTALEWHEKALAIREKVLGSNHPDTATSYNNIARVYDNMGEYDTALEWFVCAFRVVLATLGDHPNTRTALGNMHKAYDKSGKTEDFKDWLVGKLAESDRCNEKL